MNLFSCFKRTAARSLTAVAAVFAVILVFAACTGPIDGTGASILGKGRGGDEAELTIVLPQVEPGSIAEEATKAAAGSFARASIAAQTDGPRLSMLEYPPTSTMLAQISYEVDLISSKERKTIRQEGGTSIKANAAEGPITIDMRAYYNEHIYASGSITGTITYQGPNRFQVSLRKDAKGWLTISGVISSDVPGGPLAGATVQLMQGVLLCGPAITTGADGSWSVSDVEPGDGYYILVSKAGYTTGTSSPLSVADPGPSGINLTINRARYSVSGIIYGDDAASGLSGAAIQLKDSASANVGAAVTTGAGGTYTITNILPGSGYSIEVAKSGYNTETIPAFDLTGADISGKNLIVFNQAGLNADFGSTTITHTVINSANGAGALYAYLSNGGSGLAAGNYVVTLEGTGHQFTPSGAPPSAVNLGAGVSLLLRGSGRIALGANGCLFTVNSGAKLILRGPALYGKSGNTDSAVRVEAGGALVMHGGQITGNACGEGGGVTVTGSGATFTMDGGTISGNTAQGGGGVDISNGAIFTMSGGYINTNNTSANGWGGGVRLRSGAQFTMSGTAVISGNIAQQQSGAGEGGGVYIAGSTTEFTMNGGTISGNTAQHSNTAAGNQGGGVAVYTGARFTMNDGVISGNTAFYRGGGVQVNGSIFIKRGGTIYGSGEGTNSNQYTKSGGNGHAVFVYDHARARNTTAGPGVRLYADGLGTTIDPSDTTETSGNWGL